MQKSEFSQEIDLIFAINTSNYLHALTKKGDVHYHYAIKQGRQENRYLKERERIANSQPIISSLILVLAGYLR